MINVELAIALFVGAGMLVAVKQYLNQIDREREYARIDNEIEMIAARQRDPEFRTRNSDLD